MKRPDTTSRTIAAVPTQSTHGRVPNFPGEPNNPGETIQIGQSGEKHGWFHS